MVIQITEAHQSETNKSNDKSIMPRRWGSQWMCSMCDIIPFETYEDAVWHELDCQKQQRERNQKIQHQQGGARYIGSGGVSSISAGQTRTYETRQEQFSATSISTPSTKVDTPRSFSPYKLHTISKSASEDCSEETSPHVAPQEIPTKFNVAKTKRKRTKPKVLLDQATTEETARLSKRNHALCQSVLFFLENDDHKEQGQHTYSPTSSPQKGNKPSKLGFRCIYCMESPLAAPPGGFSFAKTFPGCVDSMGATLKLMCERHFKTPGNCVLMPEHVRSMFEKASKSDQSEEDDSELQEFCEKITHRLKIVNMRPRKTGISYADTDSHQRATKDTLDAFQIKEMPVQKPSPASTSTNLYQDYDSFSKTVARSSMHDTTLSSFSMAHCGDDSSTQGDAYHSRPSPLPVTQDPMRGSKDLTHHGKYGYYSASLPSASFSWDGAGWSCPKCRVIPYQLRAPGSVSFTRDYPTVEFVQQHFMICQGPRPVSYVPPFSTRTSSPIDSNHLTTSAASSCTTWQSTPDDSAEQLAKSINSYSSTSLMHGHHLPNSVTQKQHHPATKNVGDTSSAFRTSRNGTAPSPGGKATPCEESFIRSENKRVNYEFEDHNSVVLEEDRPLLTDYFYFLNRQLRMCRFTDMDRKSRGGNRDHVRIGYGGLECIHCAGLKNTRKFFWSNVDRLANSFAEIPMHIMKCEKCPDSLKTKLKELKSKHPEQMARLPRGSQKVFFRRMWRRLHQDQENTSRGGPSEGLLEDRVSSGGVAGRDTSSSGEVSELGTPAPAQESDNTSTNSTVKQKRVLLSISEDKSWLSDLDCLVRKNLEVFCATEKDVSDSETRYRVSVGRVGIRCVHCASKATEGAQDSAVAYPTSIQSIYESVQELQRLHLYQCPNQDGNQWSSLTTSASLSSVLRRYYIIAAKALGMYDTSNGIRSEGGSIPLPHDVSQDLASLNAARSSDSTWKDSGNTSSPNVKDLGTLPTSLEVLSSRKRSMRSPTSERKTGSTCPTPSKRQKNIDTKKETVSIYQDMLPSKLHIYSTTPSSNSQSKYQLCAISSS